MFGDDTFSVSKWFCSRDFCFRFQGVSDGRTLVRNYQAGILGQNELFIMDIYVFIRIYIYVIDYLNM